LNVGQRYKIKHPVKALSALVAERIWGAKGPVKHLWVCPCSQNCNGFCQQVPGKKRMGHVRCLHCVSNFYCAGAVLTHVLKGHGVPAELSSQHRLWQEMALPGWTAVGWIGSERSLWYCCNSPVL